MDALDNWLIKDSIRKMLSEELVKQDAKWDEYRVLDRNLWLVILGEEVGEACRASLEGDEVNYVDELIDVAATALQAVQSVLLARVASGKEVPKNTP